MNIFKPVYDDTIGAIDFEDGGFSAKIAKVTLELDAFGNATAKVGEKVKYAADDFEKLFNIKAEVFERTLANGEKILDTRFRGIGGKFVSLNKVVDREVAKLNASIDALAKGGAGISSPGPAVRPKGTETATPYDKLFTLNEQEMINAEKIAALNRFENAKRLHNQLLSEEESFQSRNLAILNSFLAIKAEKQKAAEAAEIARQAKFAQMQLDYQAKLSADMAARNVTMGTVPVMGKPTPTKYNLVSTGAGQWAGEAVAVGGLNKQYMEMKVATDTVGRGFTAKNAKLSAQTIATNRERDAIKGAQMAMVDSATTLKRVDAGLATHTEGVARARAQWAYWGRFLLTQSIHKAVYDIINATRTGLKEMATLQVKISEIRTIGQEAPLPFGTWEAEIRRLSDVYGMSMTDVAEGIYQTISNQVAFGANATRFMADSMVFARTTVSSTADAVNLLSSSLNAFGKTSDQTNDSAASLFKTIEIGRLRASDIANSYGNVAVTAAELGVKEDELGAMMAIMTLQGKKVDVAMTQIRNIMMKMLKPTEELGKYFKQLGYDSGEAAISAMGLPNLIRQINEEASKAGKGTPWLARLFGDIRPIQGIISLTGDQMAKFDSILEQYNTKQSQYFKATHISIESTGKLLQMEMNKVHNYFVQTLGEGALNIIKGFISDVDDGLKGLEISKTLGIKPVNDFVGAIEAAGRVLEFLSALYIGWRVRVNIVNYELAQQTLALEANTIAKTKNAVATEANTAAMAKFNPLIGGAIFVGATALVYAYMEAWKWVIKVNAEYEGLLSLDKVYEKQLAERHAKTIAQIEERVNAFKKEAEASRQVMEQGVAVKIAGLNSEVDALNATISNNVKLITDYVSGSINSIAKLINFLDSRITETSNTIKSLTASIAGMQSGSSTLSYYTGLVDKIGVTNDAQIKLNRTYQRYLDLVKAGAKFANTQDLRVLGQGDLFKRKTTTATGSAVKGVDVNGDAFTKQKKFSKDTQNEITSYELAQINERKNALDTMYAAVKKGALSAFDRRDMTEFAKYWDELIALSDKYETIGKSTGEVIRDHGRLIDERVKKEQIVLAEKKKQLDMLEEERQRNQKAKDDLEEIKTKMGNISTSAKNMPKATEELAKLYKDAQKVIGEAGLSPELTLQLKTEFGKSFSGVQENKKLIETMNSVSDSQINEMDKLNAVIMNQLKSMQKLQEKQDMIKFIEAQRDVLKEQEKALQSKADKEASKMLVPQQKGVDASSQLFKLLPKVMGESFNLSRQAMFDELFNVLKTTLPEAEAKRVATEKTNALWTEDLAKPIAEAFNGFPKLFETMNEDINKISAEQIRAAIKQVDIVTAGTKTDKGGLPTELQNNLFEMKRVLVTTMKSREESEKATESFNKLNVELKNVTEGMKGFNETLKNPVKLTEMKTRTTTFENTVNKTFQNNVPGLDFSKLFDEALSKNAPVVPPTVNAPTPEQAKKIVESKPVAKTTAETKLDTERYKEFTDAINALNGRIFELIKQRIDINKSTTLTPEEKKAKIVEIDTRKSAAYAAKAGMEDQIKKYAPVPTTVTPIAKSPEAVKTVLDNVQDPLANPADWIATPLNEIVNQIMIANAKTDQTNKDLDKLANPPRQAAEDLTSFKGVKPGNWKYNMFGTKGMQGMGGLADMGGDTFGDMSAVGDTYAKLREASIKQMNSQAYRTDWEANRGIQNWQGGISKENQKNNAPNVFDVTVTMGGETLAVKTAQVIEKGASRGQNNVSVNGQGINGATRDQPYYNVRNLNTGSRPYAR
ncbi:MAG TPA: phage tail tape measure protein [Candidatus Cloacimonadota bacterium]|nr:phage tail tape measure protein [Candidatus Cloacimonadota bacterium]